MSTAYVCKECGKPIGAQAKIQFCMPSHFAVSLGVKPATYHRACYDRAEAAAAVELYRSMVTP